MRSDDNQRGVAGLEVLYVAEDAEVTMSRRYRVALMSGVGCAEVGDKLKQELDR